MLNIIHAITPILLLIASGYAISRSGFLQPIQFEGLSKLAFVVFIPSLLFLSVYQGAQLEDLPVNLLWAFYLPVVLVFFVVFFVAHYTNFSKNIRPEFLSLACSFSNNVLIGVPILLSLLGDKILLPAFFIISFHSLLLFSLTTVVSNSSHDQDIRWAIKIAKTIWITTRSPIVLSLLMGLIFKYLSIPIPDPIITTITFLKQAAIPCALIVLGASLQQYKIIPDIKLTSFVVLIKLVILPFLIWFLCRFVFQLSDFYTSVAVVMAASPVGINVYLFSSQDSSSAPSVASTILISTLLSLVTIPCWLLFLNLT